MPCYIHLRCVRCVRSMLVLCFNNVVMLAPVGTLRILLCNACMQPCFRRLISNVPGCARMLQMHKGVCLATRRDFSMLDVACCMFLCMLPSVFMLHLWLLVFLHFYSCMVSTLCDWRYHSSLCAAFYICIFGYDLTGQLW